MNNFTSEFSDKLANPDYFISKCGMWAAIPYYKSSYIIVHNGKQVHLCRTFNSAKNFIIKESKKLHDYC
jgi:hypothetical protein